MKCPFCGNEETIVKDSREYDDGKSIKRRRVCLSCSAKFNTIEYILRKDVTVIKKNGKKEAFDKFKLKNSIKMGSGKQLTEEQLSNVVDKVLNHIDTLQVNEISTKDIGNIVLEELKKINKVAFVRFASVYMNFEDINDFNKFIKELKEE